MPNSLFHFGELRSSGKVRRDGADATRVITQLVSSSRFAEQTRAVMRHRARRKLRQNIKAVFAGFMNRSV